MTGPDHYREAERLLTHTDRSVQDQFGDGAECARQQIAMAQVHATLALAAATAIGAIDPQGGLEIGDARAWETATGSSREGTCPGGC